MIIAGTGHRPPRLGLDYTAVSNQLMVDFLITEIESLEFKPEKIISGMALTRVWLMLLS